jgi:uncharacterized UPF0146 family protein
MSGRLKSLIIIIIWEIKLWEDLCEYINQHYYDANSIAEVGVGCFTLVARALKDYYRLNIIMTDIKPFHECILQDDITQPDLKIYKKAELIYSIRPPEELHPHLLILAQKVGADLIIKPLSTDSINTPIKMNLINYKKVNFYKLCTHEMEETKHR